jgi:hypothetical protein
MAKRNAVITLDSFMDKALMKFGWDEDEFHRLHIIGADGLRELSIYHLPISLVTTLTVDTDNQTASWPDDMIDYVFIAVERDGELWTFTRNDKMVDKTISGITGADLGEYYYHDGYGSVGGKNDWYFQPDYENRRFLFSGVTSSNVVVLKYISTGVEVVNYSSSTNIEFPVYAEDSMETYLRWKWAEYTGMSGQECNRRERQYEKAVLMMRNLHNPTIDEIRDIWLGSSNQTYIR